MLILRIFELAVKPTNQFDIPRGRFARQTFYCTSPPRRISHKAVRERVRRIRCDRPGDDDALRDQVAVAVVPDAELFGGAGAAAGEVGVDDGGIFAAAVAGAEALVA